MRAVKRYGIRIARNYNTASAERLQGGYCSSEAKVPRGFNFTGRQGIYFAVHSSGNFVSQQGRVGLISRKRLAKS